MSNSSIWSKDRTQSGTTTPSQNEPGSNGNKGVLHITQSSRVGASTSDGLVSYPGQLLEWGGVYSSAEMQLAYSTAPANWTYQIKEFSYEQYNKMLSHLIKPEIVWMNVLIQSMAMRQTDVPWAKKTAIDMQQDFSLARYIFTQPLGTCRIRHKVKFY